MTKNNIEFKAHFASRDHQVLDDAVRRVLSIASDKTEVDVLPIPASTEGSMRMQRRSIIIRSTDDKILHKLERLDLQTTVNITIVSS